MKLKPQLKLILVFTVFLFLSFAGSKNTLAAVGNPNSWLSQIAPGNSIPGASLGLNFVTGNIIPFIISILLFLIIVASLVFVVVGGIMWITSAGEKEGLAKAKSTITWSLLGLILGICSFIIMGVLGKLLGANLLGS